MTIRIQPMSKATTVTTIPNNLDPIVCVLEKKGWCCESYTWHNGFGRKAFKFLNEGDFIVQCQREFETLELVQHRTDICGMQYVYECNGEYTQRFTAGGYWKDFLSEFI
jgi:hypothetical protein